MVLLSSMLALVFSFILLFLRLTGARVEGSSEVLDSDQAQHALVSGESGTLIAPPRNFSVGFSLQSSYGAAAIILVNSSGQLETHTTVFYGGSRYREVMARLSLASSQHIAPPYEDDGAFWADQPRRAGRVALTWAGLPASYEVGVLANVIHQLRTQLERAFNIQITEAVFTASHLMALYKDDLQDLATHLKLRYMRPRREFHPLVWETSSAYAGYGRGLCKAWHNDTECWQEEEREMPDVPLLSVHYSHTALTVALAEINGAGGLWEPEYRHVENFTLGRDALDDYTHEKDYWEDVREHLVFIMVEYGFRNPELVMITGDAADGEFLEHVQSTMLRHMGKVPEIISEDPVFAAAKGAAEFMRRGPLEPWSK